MTEAIGVLTLFAFQKVKFKRVTILCDSENVKSMAVAERLGFSLELVTKGLVAKAHEKGLRNSYQYVRFDSLGLEQPYPYSVA